MTKASKSKLKPEEGQLFALKLSDGTFGLAQVAFSKQTGPRTYSFAAAFFGVRAPTLEELTLRAKDEPLDTPLAVLTPSNKPVEEGEWILIGHRPAVYSNVDVASRMSGPYLWFDNRQVAWAWLLDMYHGLYPWDAFYDPAWLDKLLLPGQSRPAHARLKASFPKEFLAKLGVKA